MIRQLRWQIALAAAGILVIGALLVIVSDRADTPDERRRGGRFTEALVGQPQTYNPLLARTEAEVSLSRLLFSGLTRSAPSAPGGVEPYLAESFEVSADGLTYTFNLRQDALWHDGEKVTADDVLFTIGLIQDPAFLGAELNRLAEPWQNASLERLGDYQLSIRLAEPYAPFLMATMLSIVPEHLLADTAPEEIAQSRDRFSTFAPVGAGPYALSPRGDEAANVDVLTHFDAHWNHQAGSGFLDTIVFQYHPTPEDAVAAIGRREAQGMGRVPAEAIDELGDEVQIYSAAQAGYTLIYLNPSDPLLRNASVRSALSRSLNREGIIDDPELLNGQGLPASGPIPSGSWAHDSQIAPPEFDPAVAERVLDEAGWIDSDNNGIRDRDGQDLALTLGTRADNPLLVAIAERAREDWASVGISVTVQALSPQNVAATMRDRAFAALLVSLELPFYDPDPYAFWHSSQIAPPGQNFAGFASDAADRALDQAKSRQPVDGFNQRVDDYAAFQENFMTEMPALMICYPVYTYAVTDASIGGIQLPPLIVEPADRFLTLSDWFSQAERGFGGD